MPVTSHARFNAQPLLGFLWLICTGVVFLSTCP
jgi:hypothetical protein